MSWKSQRGRLNPPSISKHPGGFRTCSDFHITVLETFIMFHIETCLQNSASKCYSSKKDNKNSNSNSNKNTNILKSISHQ